MPRCRAAPRSSRSLVRKLRAFARPEDSIPVGAISVRGHLRRARSSLRRAELRLLARDEHLHVEEPLILLPRGELHQLPVDRLALFDRAQLADLDRVVALPDDPIALARLRRPMDEDDVLLAGR